MYYKTTMRKIIKKRKILKDSERETLQKIKKVRENKRKEKHDQGQHRKMKRNDMKEE